MAKYKDLKNKMVELEKVLFLRNGEIKDAHKKCDELDVPQSNAGAFVGHRLLWYSEGKRQSFKTKDNVDGCPADEFKLRMERLETLRTPPPKQKKKETFSLPQLKDEDLIQP